MKKVIARIIPIFFFAAFFAVVVQMNIPYELKNQARLLTNKGKLSGTCYTGDGSLYYVNEDTTLYEGPSIRYKDIENVSGNSAVKAYCEENGFVKVSKTSDKWLSKNVLSPMTLADYNDFDGGFIEETTDFLVSEPVINGEGGLESLYTNRLGSVFFSIYDIRNIAIDEAEALSISVYKNGSEVTHQFDVNKGWFDGTSMDITLGLKSEQGYTAGTYSVQVRAKGITKMISFTMLGDYYHFDVDWQQISHNLGNPANVENEWHMTLKDVFNISSIQDYQIAIKKGNTNYTSRFNITRSEDTIVIKNKTGSRTNRPPAGDYKVTISYGSSSGACGIITYTFDFTIGNRQLVFERLSIESHRYDRTPLIISYELQILKKTATHITYILEGTTHTDTIENFKSVYTAVDVTSIAADENGAILYRFDEGAIVKATDAQVSYYDLQNNLTTVTKSAFVSAYKKVYDAFIADEKYNTDASGNLIRFERGQRTIPNKLLLSKNQNILALSGGEITFVYHYEDISEDDFNSLKYAIMSEDGTTLTEEEGFSIEYSHTDSEMTIKLIYDNTDEKYIGDYYISLKFPDVSECRVDFHLYDAEVDYYLNAQVEQGYSSEVPANKKIKWEIALYLQKAGLDYTYINPRLIDVSIYDKMADLDEAGNLFFYEQVDYDIEILKYKDALISYKVTIGDETQEVIDEAFEVFKSKYATVADDVLKYQYDASGNLIKTTDNFDLHIKSFTPATGGDMLVTYVDQAGAQKQMLLQEFRTKYPDMYAYVVTRFLFDASGNIIMGRLKGSYIVKERDGKPIEGHEITNLFDIEITDDETNITNPITITPKSEIDPGQYYVYVAYDNYIGVGYVNKEEDAVISRENYPDMWMQNIHRTSITYVEPVYEIETSLPELSNTGNDKKRMYTNIESKATIRADLIDIYTYAGIDSKIEYYDEDADEWVDASSYFKKEDNLNRDSNQLDGEQYVLSLITKGTIPSGKYRATISYENRKQTASSSQEFEVLGKYYGLFVEDTEPDPLEFYPNQVLTAKINMKGYYINDPDKIVPSLVQKISGLSDTSLQVDTEKHEFKNRDGVVLFTYNTEVDETYYKEEGIIRYVFSLTNVKDQADMALYDLTFDYQEEGEEATQTTLTFEVLKAAYEYNVENDYPYATEDEMYILKDIETQYIDTDELDDFQYILERYSTKEHQWVDVSTPGVSYKMTKSITDTWDAQSEDYDDTVEHLTHKGQIKISLDREAIIELDGDYRLGVVFKDEKVRYFDMPSLKTLFDWTVDKIEPRGKFYDEETNEVLDVKGFYQNLQDTGIDIEVNTQRKDTLHWVINKECLDVLNNDNGTCDFTSGANYNRYFTEENTIASNQQLKLNYHEVDGQKLEKGHYALVLYYTTRDVKMFDIEVKGNYADIVLKEATIYSDIKDKTADGLYKNKVGHLYLPVRVYGMSYEDTLVSVTDSNGGGNYKNVFVYDESKYLKDHILDITYNPSVAEALAQGYRISISCDTGDEVIERSLDFTMNAEYFNYTLGEPKTEPDPLLPDSKGKVTFQVDTEDIENVANGINGQDVLSEKHNFAKQTKVYNARKQEVTSSFKISAVNNLNGPNSFDLVLEQLELTSPGTYTIEVSYTYFGRELKKTKTFTVANFYKSFQIDRVEMLSDTLDKLLHKNKAGTYRVYYSSGYDLDRSKMSAKVFNATGIDVTSSFDINVFNDYVDVYYKGTNQVDAGDLKIVLSYKEDDMKTSSDKEIIVKMLGNYKEIILSNLFTTFDRIYGDVDGQYYTFDVDTTFVGTEELKPLVENAFGVDVTAQFKVTKESSIDQTDTYRLDILPFVSPVGEYKISMFTVDEVGEKNLSNALDFTVDALKYKITLTEKSTLKQKISYNSQNVFYDKDGFVGHYEFVSDYKEASSSDYSVLLMKDGKVVSVIKDGITYDDAKKVYVVDFESGALEKGDYEVAIALFSLPYDKKEAKVEAYIKATSVSILLNGTVQNGDATFYQGQTRTISYQVEPKNATNQNFNFSVGSGSIAQIKNNTLEIVGAGTTSLRVSNGEIEKEIRITALEHLTSDLYEMNYSDMTIYVNRMTTTKLLASTFLKHIFGLQTNYQIFDSKGQNITSIVGVIGTNMSIKNGNETYKIIVIGDINGDGSITGTDVGALYQYTIGKRRLDANQLKAGRIRKVQNITGTDVAALYQFSIGKRQQI